MGSDLPTDGFLCAPEIEMSQLYDSVRSCCGLTGATSSGPLDDVVQRVSGVGMVMVEGGGLEVIRMPSVRASLMALMGSKTFLPN